MSINVYWWATERMSFSCVAMLNQMFDAYQCAHFDRTNPPPSDSGCVLVCHGGNLQLFGNGPVNAKLISDHVESQPWVIFVVIGDEGTEFRSRLLHHLNCRLWLQSPQCWSVADRYLIQGYPASTKRFDPMPTRDLDYFFSGQDTHIRRHQCRSAIAKYWESNPNGMLLCTGGFSQGLPVADYLHYTARARFVPCPAGPSTVDTFRVYEALEMGAVPILDSRSLHPDTAGVWPKLLGDHPLPMIQEWGELPELMPKLLKDHGVLALSARVWWAAYKKNFASWLAQDLLTLNARPILSWNPAEKAWTK